MSDKMCNNNSADMRCITTESTKTINGNEVRKIPYGLFEVKFELSNANSEKLILIINAMSDVHLNITMV